MCQFPDHLGDDPPAQHKRMGNFEEEMVALGIDVIETKPTRENMRAACRKPSGATRRTSSTKTFRGSRISRRSSERRRRGKRNWWPMPIPATSRRRPYPTAGSSKRAFPATNDTGTDLAWCLLLHRSWRAPGSLQRDIVHAVSTCTPNGASLHFRDSLTGHLPARVGVTSGERPASIGS